MQRQANCRRSSGRPTQYQAISRRVVPAIAPASCAASVTDFKAGNFLPAIPRGGDDVLPGRPNVILAVRPALTSWLPAAPNSAPAQQAWLPSQPTARRRIQQKHRVKITVHGRRAKSTWVEQARDFFLLAEAPAPAPKFRPGNFPYTPPNDGVRKQLGRPELSHPCVRGVRVRFFINNAACTSQETTVINADADARGIGRRPLGPR